MNDWMEGCLSEKDEVKLFEFLEQNPDLLDEYDDISAIALKPREIAFSGKQALKRTVDELDELDDFDRLAVTHLEEGLSNHELEKLHELARLRPHGDEELELYQKVLLQPDSSVVFEAKSKLRHYVSRATVFTTITQIASVAAAVAAIVWLTGRGWDNPVSPQLATLTDTAAVKVESPSVPIASEGNEMSEKDSTGTPAQRPKTEIKKSAPSSIKHIDAYISHEEPLLAALESKGVDEFYVREINAYETALGTIIPLYLESQANTRELYALYNTNQDETSPKRIPFLVEGGVKLMNVFGGERVKLNRFYDANGNLVAYELKSGLLEVERKVK
jgi:hypothetical protein